MSSAVLSSKDFNNLVSGGEISIYTKLEDTLNGDMLQDVHKDKNYSFKNFKKLEQKYFLDSKIFHPLVGEEVIVHYPDSSSWATNFHLEVVKINRIEKSESEPETSNAEGFTIVLESLKNLPDNCRFKYYHESSCQYIDTFRENGTPWKIFISPELYSKLKKIE